MSVVFPVLPDLADELGVSRGRIGLVQGAVAVPGIFLATYTGYLADRFGRRTVIRWSLLIFGFAGVASFFARSFWPLIATRLVQGLGTSGLMSLGVVVIGDMFVGLERRWAMGMNIAAVTGTTALAPVFGGLLAEGGAFRPFLLTTLAFPLWFFASALPDKPADPVTTRPFVHFRSALDDLRQNRRIGDFLGVLPMSLITLGSFVGLGLTVTPLFLERVFDVSVSRRGFIMAFGAGASSLTSLLAGRIGARIQRGRILMVAFGLMTAGFIVLATAPDVWVIPFGLAMMGMGTGLIFPMLQDYMASAGPARYRGALVGTWVSANRLGQATGPVAASALASGAGERATYLVGAAMMATVGLVWRPMRRTVGRAVDNRR